MDVFLIRPIDPSIANAARRTLRDPIYGSPLRVEPAAGYGPCRLCLRTFAPGEPRILFLYNPFSAHQDAEFAGPVFVHADGCKPYAEPTKFPDAVAALPIELRAYDDQQRRVGTIVPDPGECESAVGRLFARPEVHVVHIRNTEARCFIARIDRANQPNVLTSSR